MKTLRQKMGLKAEEVAIRLEIGVSTIRNWEQGRTTPRLRVDQFTELCRLYRCSIEELNRAAKESIKEGSAPLQQEAQHDQFQWRSRKGKPPRAASHDSN